jgi:uncharacterized membrane protein YkoI
MVVLRTLLLGLICLAPVAAAAAEKKVCLSPQERNAAIAARKAVPLARAMRVVKAKIAGEVVNARLCRQEIGPATAVAGATGAATKGLVYVLTVLARNGKVTQARVDAADGHWLGGS